MQCTDDEWRLFGVADVEDTRRGSCWLLYLDTAPHCLVEKHVACCGNYNPVNPLLYLISPRCVASPVEDWVRTGNECLHTFFVIGCWFKFHPQQECLLAKPLRIYKKWCYIWSLHFSSHLSVYKKSRSEERRVGKECPV